jgi:5'-3' exonuclease/transcription antitermination factor NusG
MIQDLPWVVLELTSKADGEDPDIIRASIRHHIRDAEVFIPASVVQRGPVREYQYLVEGYAFILHKHPDSHYSRLEETKFVQNPLYVSSGTKKDRKLATVTSEQIEKLRAQIIVEVDQGIEVGDTVMISSGPYKNIKALVADEIQEHDSVVVHIQLRSTDRLVTLPRAFLHLESKSPYTKHRERFKKLSAWTSGARKVALWPKERMEGILSQQKTLAMLDRAVSILGQITGSASAIPDISGLLHCYKEMTLLNSACRRMLNIYRDVQQMTSTDNLNLIVDGTQLFIRCASAPGLGSLSDSQGRVTGPVVGFLRALGAYRKRFPAATIYVCWDGSSQRRKAMYEGYKGNRASRSGEPAFGWDWLRETLPKLGVHQAWNPSEEADDVMASLAWGPLQYSPNILVTSDRDLLQVVSESTHQLCPAVGAGTEKLYDPNLVTAEYGVPPASLVQLRALSGDTSDHIPGVPNFGLKTASKVIKMYGDVDTLFKSNLAGMSKTHASNLRASEAQVRLNTQLMALQQVPFTEIRSNPDQTEAEVRIKSLEIKPESILQAFFPAKAG